MPVELGPRDEKRFRALDEETRDYLGFQLDLCLGILSRRPQHLEALASAANALTALGYYADGLALDRRLSALRPEDPVVVYNLACSLALAGQNDEALTVLAQAIRLGYREAEHMAQDPDLVSLQKFPQFRQLLAEVSDKAESEDGESAELA